jgi:hypothetical protein
MDTLYSSVLSISSLDQALKDLDAHNGVRKEFHLTLDPHRERQRQLPPDDIYKNMPDFKDLTHAQMSIVSALLESLAMVDKYADKAASMGEKGDAERAYLRMREVYRSLPFNVTISYKKLLWKIAVFYATNEEPLQAETYLLEYFQSCDNSAPPDEGVWRCLAQVLSESSRELNRGLEMSSKIVPPGKFAFPPLHRIFRSGCISSAPPLIFGMESFPDITHSPPLHALIAQNNPAAFVVIEESSDDQLESRDMYSRTPMLLTALFMAEDIGVALMKRYKAYPIEARRRLVDARDHMGQTILAIAIRRDCTFEFIKALVENCANVDPDPIELILSPLQAAALQRRMDVTALLLSYGARDSNTFYGEVRASTLAHSLGYLDIEALIIAETPS